MKRQEFLDKMDEVRTKITDFKVFPRFICIELRKEFGNKACVKFDKIFRPKERCSSWVIDSDLKIKSSDIAFERRMTALCFFEEMCLTYKLYKDW